MIELNLLPKAECNHSETNDLAARFKIRAGRHAINLSHPLFTPNGDGFVSILVHGAKGKIGQFILKGDSINDLPVVPFDEETYQDTYNSFDEWVNHMIYVKNENDGYPHLKYFKYPWITMGAPPLY